MSNVKTTYNSKNQQLIFGDGPVARAYLIFYSKAGEREKEEKTIPVQFNPEELSISRSVSYKDTSSLGNDSESDNQQAVDMKGATLSVELYVDAASTFHNVTKSKNIEKYVGDKGVTKFVSELSELMINNHDLHKPFSVKFCWGTLMFEGVAESMNVNYEMFDRNGIPVQAKISLSIQGEEKSKKLQMVANPKQSPDRTKYRIFNQTDQLWMLANEEYGDPTLWKEIAVENEILNPRKVNKATMLKVPAI